MSNVHDLACERARALAVERLQRPLAAGDTAWLTDHHAGCEVCRADADDLAATWDELDAVAAPAPSPSLRLRFRQTLAAEARALAAVAPRPGASPWLQVAAAVLLVTAGALLGALLADRRAAPELASLQGEVRTLTSTVAVSMLRQEAASDRLVGVRYGEQAAGDATVVAALLDAVRADPSVNVRLAALDVLARMAGRPEVQERLLQDLPRQRSPMAQAAIVDVLAEHGGPAVRRRLADLAADTQLDPAVREHLRRVLSRPT